MKKIFILSLVLFSSTSFAAEPSPDITDAIAVASLLAMFGLGFIAGCK